MSQPNFFIIGTAKSGSTALHEYLSGHPNIFMSNPKEPEYFATDFPGIRITKTEKEYLKLFETASKERYKIIGESSVLYIYSSVAISKIKESYPNAKLVAILRHPIDLMYSSFSHISYSGRENVATFEEAWALQEERAKGKKLPLRVREPKLLQYRDFAMIGKQLERVYATFPKEQVKVIFHEDFVKDKRKVYSEVLDFLNLPNDGKSDFELINANKEVGNMFIHKVLTYILDQTSKLKPFLPKQAHKILKGLNFIDYFRNKNIDFSAGRKPLELEFKKNIIKEFEADIKKIEHLTGRDLKHWMEFDN